MPSISIMMARPDRSATADDVVLVQFLDKVDRDRKLLIELPLYGGAEGSITACQMRVPHGEGMRVGLDTVATEFFHNAGRDRHALCRLCFGRHLSESHIKSDMI
jgi:hypothetical protein